MSAIDVSIGIDDRLRAAWPDLVARAPANVFMDPTGLAAVADSRFARTHVLSAWDRASKKLLGVWALEERRMTPLGPRYLSSPPHYYSFVGSPVIAGDRLDEVAAAFLNAIAADRRLPNVVRLKYLDGDSPVHGPLMRAIATHAGQAKAPSIRTRPFASRDSGIKRSGSTRKKLRQDWNRLSALGTTVYRNERTAAGAVAGFEIFLQMEMASWKGENGTALLCKAADAAFVRRFFAALAAEGKASVALLTVDGKPVAAQVLLYCGRWAYTWKIAFSVDYGRYSPGAVLVDKVAEDLFADEIDAIESCSPEGGFMAQMWDGRRTTVDVLASLSDGPSPALALITLRDRAHAAMKETRNRLRALDWSKAGKPRAAAGEILRPQAGSIRGNLRLIALAFSAGLAIAAGERGSESTRLDDGTPQEGRLLDKALDPRAGHGG